VRQVGYLQKLFKDYSIDLYDISAQSAKCA